MINIGESINEAIDWTQDRLCTTRPIAERTLFSLLAGKAVTETDDGFVLVEEEEVEKQHKKVKDNLSKNWKTFNNYKFHVKRKTAKQQLKTKHHLHHLDNSTAAEGMLAADEAINAAIDDGML